MKAIFERLEHWSAISRLTRQNIQDFKIMQNGRCQVPEGWLHSRYGPSNWLIYHHSGTRAVARVLNATRIEAYNALKIVLLTDRLTK